MLNHSYREEAARPPSFNRRQQRRKASQRWAFVAQQALIREARNIVTMGIEFSGLDQKTKAVERLRLAILNLENALERQDDTRRI